MLRPRFDWKLRTRTLALGRRTLVMGIVNVTPDSFADGGKFFSLDHAVGHALELLDEGAEVVDIGGESTRPGKKEPVSAEEEMRRVLPVVEQVRRERPQAVISVDTYKSSVARAAVEAGAEMVNDVSGLRWDTQMAGAVAELQCGVVITHMRGRPDQWRHLPPLPDPLPLVKRELRQSAEGALRSAIARECILLDPGFGFGKNFEENYPLLAGFDQLHELGFPLLAGPSRKSFLGRTLADNQAGQDAPPEARLHGTLAAVTAAILQGAHIVRVHDVKPVVEAARVADAILAAAGE